jgi:hypothetical protein
MQTAMITNVVADASSAAGTMRDFIRPTIETMCALASLVCVFFLVNGGIAYMTSSGKVDNLEHAKKVIKNALLGLILVIAAAVLTQILVGAYSGSSAVVNAKLPNLTTVQPASVSNGLVAVLIKAVTGLLNNIIQTIAAPFLSALSFFTSGTPLMAANSAVFNLWEVMVGISDALLVLIIALLGFHVMGASTFGFDEIEFKQLLPRIGLIFLLANVSIFFIDGIITLSNAMIKAINVDGGSNSVWSVLTAVVKQASGESIAGLLIMLVFIIFAFILLVYYVGRLVTLYIGAVLAPIALLLWLLPGFKDFTETAIKTYLMTIFVLFVHVVILLLAASLFAGLIAGSPDQSPDALMAMIVGVATLIALLKTQGLMMQFSYVSMGSRNAKMLGRQFINGMSFVNQTSTRASSTVTKNKDSYNQSSVRNNRRPGAANSSYTQPQSRSTVNNSTAATNNSPNQAVVSKPRPKTGTTTVAPKQAKVSLPPEAKVAKPINKPRKKS